MNKNIRQFSIILIIIIAIIGYIIFTKIQENNIDKQVEKNEQEELIVIDTFNKELILYIRMLYNPSDEESYNKAITYISSKMNNATKARFLDSVNNYNETSNYNGNVSEWNYALSKINGGRAYILYRIDIIGDINYNIYFKVALSIDNEITIVDYNTWIKK